MTTLIAYALIQFSILTSGADKTKDNSATITTTQTTTTKTYGGTGGWDDKD